jgi:hypothetical protein
LVAVVAANCASIKAVDMKKAARWLNLAAFVVALGGAGGI